MPSWFFSLHLRLILGFTLVLALALAGISWYVASAAQREAERFQQQVEQARAARVQRLISRQYSTRRGWTDPQPVIEQAGELYGWRIVVTDRDGKVIADSDLRSGLPWREAGQRSQLFPVVSDGSRVGSVTIAPSELPRLAPEPPLSRLVSSVNRSLLWTGLAAGAGGILLVLVMSRRILAPVRLFEFGGAKPGPG